MHTSHVYMYMYNAHVQCKITFYVQGNITSGVDPRKNLTDLLESERQIYGSPEANVLRFSLSTINFIIFPSILSHLVNLTDFRKTV